MHSTRSPFYSPVIEITAKVAGNLVDSLENYWRVT